jgi:L-ascorbate peroxidase
MMGRVPTCSPLLLRLAWSDACTYNKHHDSGNATNWPACGGCNGSIRFPEEYTHEANLGLHYAIELLKPIRKRCSSISWADLIQLAGCLAVEFCDGPKLLPRMRFGRLDASSYEATLRDRSTSSASIMSTHDRYPSPKPPFPEGAKSADMHLRNVFYKMDFTNKDIVALCGAHTIGRAFANRTGVCKFSSGDSGATIYTASHCHPKVMELNVPLL